MLPRLPVALATLLSLVFTSAAVPTSDLDRSLGVEPRAYPGRKCGNDLTPEAVSAREKDFASLLAEKKPSDRIAVPEGNFTVPVNFNVIYASTNISDGYIP
jgi:hypothetical protein